MENELLPAELQKPDRISRKEFLARLGAGTCLASLLLWLAGLVRAVVPSALPTPSLAFKIGRLRDYFPGVVKVFDEQNVVVFCDDQGLYAISLVCTHLGCIVLHSEAGFHCPCHGSKFDVNGALLKGPAPAGLSWMEITLLPNGQLSVDRGKTVKLGVKFAVPPAEQGAA